MLGDRLDTAQAAFAVCPQSEQRREHAALGVERAVDVCSGERLRPTALDREPTPLPARLRWNRRALSCNIAKKD